MKKRIISLLVTILFSIPTFGGSIIVEAKTNDITKYYCTVCNYGNTNSEKVNAHIQSQHQDLINVEPTLAEKINFKSYKQYIVKDNVKIYSKPNSKSKVIKKVQKGKRVTVIGVQGKWRRVGVNKWIYYKNLTSKNPNKYYNNVKLLYNETYKITKNKLTKSKGVNKYNGNKETWYSQNELSGKGLTIPGRHVANDGTIRDKNGYLVVACNPSYKKKGTKIMTSLGPAIVRDCGCAYGVVDIYVAW